MPKTACATVVKNGGRKFAEWIAYQFVIGFDAVLILDNGSTDDTREIAERFRPRFDVRVSHWDRTDPSYQRAGYDHMIRATQGEFEWVACFDSDEFLVLPEKRPLAELLAVPADVAGIVVPWAIFGSSGLDAAPDDLVIRAFQRRAPESFGPNRHIKSIVRPSKFITCTNVHFFALDGTYVDMRHTAITVSSAQMKSEPDYTVGQLNHYFVQSKADWAAKLARGYHDCQRSFDEFFHYDRNEIFDNGAARHAPAVDRILGHVLAQAARG